MVPLALTAPPAAPSGSGSSDPATVYNNNHTVATHATTATETATQTIKTAAAMTTAPETSTLSTQQPPPSTPQQMFTWEKLSPAEFQQLQDFAACA